MTKWNRREKPISGLRSPVSARLLWTRERHDQNDNCHSVEEMTSNTPARDVSLQPLFSASEAAARFLRATQLFEIPQQLIYYNFFDQQRAEMHRLFSAQCSSFIAHAMLPILKNPKIYLKMEENFHRSMFVF